MLLSKNAQTGFKPSGSSEAALIDLTHAISVMLEDNKYVRCLLIDFSTAYDTVNHAILMKKLVEYGLDQYVIAWVLSFLTDRTQFSKVGTKISRLKAINLSIVQGSEVGPCQFIILVADLRHTETTNHLGKYADDATLSRGVF